MDWLRDSILTGRTTTPVVRWNGHPLEARYAPAIWRAYADAYDLYEGDREKIREALDNRVRMMYEDQQGGATALRNETCPALLGLA